MNEAAGTEARILLLKEQRDANKIKLKTSDACNFNMTPSARHTRSN
jgi:hypothetical protein